MPGRKQKLSSPPGEFSNFKLCLANPITEENQASILAILAEDSDSEPDKASYQSRSKDDVEIISCESGGEGGAELNFTPPHSDYEEDYYSESDFGKNASQPPNKKKKLTSNKRKYNTHGRAKDLIWNEYHTVIANGTKTYRCNFCEKAVSGRACRLIDHNSRCNSKIKKTQKLAPVAATSSNIPVSAPASSVSETVSGKTLKQRTLDSFVDKVSPDEQKLLNKKLAKCMYSANLPFQLVENVEFLDFMKTIRPQYKVPTRFELADGLLKSTYDEVKQSVRNDLKGKEVTILQDGWSTNQNSPVIAHSVSTGTKSYFIKAENAGTNKKDAEYCKKLLEDTINELEEEYECKVIGTVNDSCNVMKSMRIKILEDYPELYAYGCHSHLLNLVGKDLTPEELRKKIVKVQTYFRNHHYESESLKEKKGLRPKLPGDTRWNSQLDCFDNYLKNNAKYLEISRDPKSSVTPEIKQIIRDDQLYQELTEATSVLLPVAKALDKLQGDSSTVADAVDSWIWIYGSLGNRSNNKKFLDRMRIGLEPAAIAAYMLHPKYRGKKLETLPLEFRDAGKDWLNQKNPLFTIAAMNLACGNEDFYSKASLDSTVSSKTNPVIWWMDTGKDVRLPRGLGNLAQTLMKLPATSAGLERSFSTLSKIITKLRNRLGVEKASMLCFIHQYLRVDKTTEVLLDESDFD